MTEYHKIETVYLRNPETKYRTLLMGQYAKPEFAYLAENEWVLTEKVDGTNIRVIVSADGKLIFGGKTDDAQIPAFLVSKLEARFFPQHARLQEMFPDGGCLYGEGYGARIQKVGGNYRLDVDFVLFDVKVGDWWLQRHDVGVVAEKLSLDSVPIIGVSTLPEMVELAKTGFTSWWGNFLAEGIVARPTTELRSRSGNRIITKIKTKDFL